MTGEGIGISSTTTSARDRDLVWLGKIIFPANSLFERRVRRGLSRLIREHVKLKAWRLIEWTDDDQSHVEGVRRKWVTDKWGS